VSSPQVNYCCFQFDDFVLGAGDEVIIRDGRNKKAPPIHTFSGSTLPDTVIVSYGNAMMVTFHTDFVEEARGFKASYVEGTYLLHTHK
jgi:hypothetical protein